ncbi:hypothetical protein QJS10_CPB21g01019 [Acorus calamus]|uniref:Uncharacterized protein n=1 Tax=Acorus calamus TaxID=4465 RepID=A0AAV9C2K7_ACOCL|nr:hypothetical protein QJS10_CPB21g01019 [Acorus calamus]
MEFSNSHVKKQPSQKQMTICETKSNELPWMLKAFLYLNVIIAIYRSPKDWYIIAINVFIAHLSSTPEKAHQVHKTTLTLSVAGCMEVIAMEDPAKHWPLVACAIANLIASNLVLVMTTKPPPDDGSSCGFSKNMRWVIFVIANVANLPSLYRPYRLSDDQQQQTIVDDLPEEHLDCS